MRILLCLVLGVGFLLFAPAEGRANIFEQLVMPGEVIQGHAKYEKKCENCHEPFSKASQIRLCLACHKEIATDIDAKAGFHGKRRDVRGSECKHCHTDHKGRDEDIVRLDKENFDHGASDFPLRGAHSSVSCESCHASNLKYREAPTKCAACHGKQDPHKNRLGEACADCHTEKAWSEARFDHDKTEFPLKDTHKKVSCKSCHPDERYKATPTKCSNCHRLNDVHAGQYGKKCEACHSPKKWKKISFNHDKQTTFALIGRHIQVKCDSCHTGHLYKQDLGTTCFACHKSDDEHKGRNGKKCKKCHTPRGWEQSSFNHDKDTRFQLRDRHAKLKCQDCHRGQVYEEKLAATCYSCHREDDVHQGTLGKKCAACHGTADWKKVAFNHDKDTRFRLEKRHKKLACRACHMGPDPKKEKLGTACFTCHQKDDVHKGQQGKRCESCHNEAGWGAEVFFDHDLTRFPLIGLHATVPCEECHLTPKYKNTLLKCIDCHKSKDVHEGRLGSNCDLCHNPNSWAFWRFDHDRQTDYRLDGAHLGLDCRACHREVVEREINLPTACFRCHRKDDVHRRSFGTRCERCHTTDSFKTPNQVR